MFVINAEAPFQTIVFVSPGFAVGAAREQSDTISGVFIVRQNRNYAIEKIPE